MESDASLIPVTHHEAPWPVARSVAHDLAAPLPVESVTIEDALGLALAGTVSTLTDLPAFDTVSMDGWAVSSCQGPWEVIGPVVLAGSAPPSLAPGQAVPIATGAALPAGAVAVLRREHGRAAPGRLEAAPDAPPVSPMTDVRPRGEEATSGTQVLAGPVPLTPPMLGLAAAAGHDVLAVRPAPVVDVFIMGDELLIQGRSGHGRLRDSLRPQVFGWLTSVGARPGVIAHLPDTAPATTAALIESRADLVVTTGGTARGPVDQLHPALDAAGATLCVDQVAVRPGHPMVLARLPDGPPVVGLPGNPLAAAVAFLTLGWPVIERLRGLSLTQPTTTTLAGDVTAPPDAHRLMPSRRGPEGAEPLLHHGPAMLSGLAAADCLAVVPPGGAAYGDDVAMVPLPWRCG